MTYETNNIIPRLSDVRKRERNELEFRVNNECMILLKKAIEYYRINYPNSKHNHTWTDPKFALGIGNKLLMEELNRLTEKELSDIYTVFKYFHDERQMNIPDHRNRNKILSEVSKIIPGGRFLEKLHGLYKKRDNTQKKITELESQLEIERGRLTIKLTEKKVPDKGDLECPACGRVCGNRGGLTMHMRTHERKE